MVGVTGTNGKTTVTHLVSSVLERAGMPTGIVGTLLGERTTPEAPDLQRRLAAFRDDGHQAVAMEVSSHALAQHRVDAIVFDVAAFTNLSRDHLDHHGSMEAYFRAKATLFEPARSRTAVIAVDDPWGARLASELARTDVVPVRWNEATGIVTTVGSTSFRWRGRSITLPLTGRFNVANALVAATVATVLGVDEDTVAEGLAAVAPVPGRMEVVAAEDPFSVIVDYAHSPAGLEVALRAARHVAGPGRVICLFGCGGDRDAGKRPQMGEVASLLSDVVVITSDNPRSEDPAAIIDQIRPGLRPGAETVVEPDRAAAIGLAIGTARPGDVVLLAGKGHETTQSTAGRTVPFDDRMEARRALARGPGGNPA
jgi:UDP-N-acetylmuramoyl-L-alanyl-D-glutamate--2,6-diaminopimelate ligase